MNVETTATPDGGKRQPGLTLLFLLIGGFAVAAGLWFGATTFRGLSKPQPPTLGQGTLLAQPRPLADFALIDQDGRPYTLANLRGAWTFLAIGYTHCPDVCPMTLATFDAIERRIAESASGDQSEPRPRFLFISVDPERDTPERLAQYVRYFNPAFLGATGEEPQLRALAAQLGLLYARVEGQATAMGYLMDHSGSVLLVDPQGRLTAIFSTPHDAALMASDFLTIAANHQP
ncbi:MAG: SCO family protein [Bdellovibrio bacteriovorus]